MEFSWGIMFECPCGDGPRAAGCAIMVVRRESRLEIEICGLSAYRLYIKPQGYVILSREKTEEERTTNQ